MDSNQLNSWQEIADYLGVSVRTVQRWEREQGLPVSRAGGRIASDKEAIDRWQAFKGNGRWRNVRFLRYYAAATSGIVLLLLGTLAGWFLSEWRVGAPALARFEPNLMVALDGSGREVWRKSFPRALLLKRYEPSSEHQVVWFGDLDGDGRTETLLTLYTVDLETKGADLLCFDDRGNEKWRFKPGRVVGDALEEYSDTYVIQTFAVADRDHDGVREVLVNSHHLFQYPNQLAELDPSGKVQGEFWHSGQLPMMDVADWDGDGKDEIFLGGTNNGYERATVAIIAGTPSGASKQPVGDSHQLAGFEPTTATLLLLQRTCVNRAVGPYNIVDQLVAGEDSIRVVTREKGSDADQIVIYTIGSDLTVTNVVYSDLLKSLHHELELSGVLDHSLSAAEIDGLRNVAVVTR